MSFQFVAADPEQLYRLRVTTCTNRCHISHMTNRRYTDDEVAAIFRAATEGSESRALPDASAGGLTLTDLQSIAREVGISPDAVSRAALN